MIIYAILLFILLMLLITLILFTIFFLFLLFSFYINGYGNLADKNINTSKNSQQVIIESIIPVKTHKPVNFFAKKNKGKDKTKFHRLKTDKRSKIDEQIHKQPPLDLTLPFIIREITNSPGSGGNHYLPDFFSKNKHKAKNPLQVDGKFIKREEKELDKESKVDGIGINFKLRQ